MTRKHFEALAAALAAAKPVPSELATGAYNRGTAYQWITCVLAVADVCDEANERFDRERFMIAADAV